MSYTDFEFSQDKKLIKYTENKKWDFCLSCFEPLDIVTGGIGTYTRHLLFLLNDSDKFKSKNVAFFCRHISPRLKSQLSSHITIFEIGDDHSVYQKRSERMGNEHDWYSWNLAHFILKLSLSGHTFNFFEFSDYAIESYYTIKMIRAGLVSIGSVAIRLHSPELMLFRDNCLPARHYDINRFTRMSRELFCYQHADTILYGAPAMLERVQSECSRFGTSIVQKSLHIEHPYPIYNEEHNNNKNKETNTIHIAYIGRLEIRKGILYFLEKISNNKKIISLIEDLDIVFNLFGADCTDQYFRSVQKQILSLQKVSGLQGRIIVHGYSEQKHLNQKTKEMDAFIFPSLFENYPNSLLEILHTDKAVLISSAGGMPYITNKFPGVYIFDYLKNFETSILSFLCSTRSFTSRPALYNQRSSYINTSIVDDYYSAIEKNTKATKNHSSRLAVDFIIPYFNDSEYFECCLKSIKNTMSEDDFIYVIDDASRDSERHLIHKIIYQVFPTKSENIIVKSLSTNSGPSVARNIGAEQGKNPLIQFIDSDDNLDRTGFLVSKRYIERNYDVDFVYGLQNNFGFRSHVWMPRDSSLLTAIDENYTHSAVLIRRKVFNNVGGYDQSLRLHFEDWQFNCKLSLNGYRGEVIPFVTQNYRVRETSRTFRNTAFEDFSREQVIDRTFIHRRSQSTLLEGELIELLGKYANTIHGKWEGSCNQSSHSSTFEHQKNLSYQKLMKLNDKNFINAAYFTILGRKPDPEGYNFYSKQLSFTSNKEQIIYDLLHSKESKYLNRKLPKEYYKRTRFMPVKNFFSW